MVATLGEYRHLARPQVDVLMYPNTGRRILHRVMVGGDNRMMFALARQTPAAAAVPMAAPPGLYGDLIADCPPLFRLSQSRAPAPLEPLIVARMEAAPIVFRKVLVTGGAGFIGSHTVDALLAAGYQVRVLDSLEPQVHGAIDTPPAHLSREAEFIRGDVRDRDLLLRCLDGCDAVIHDAAQVGVAQSQYQILRYAADNVVGTATLCDILATEKHGVQRLLVASSMSIYGEGLYRRPSDGALVAPPVRTAAQLERGEFELRDPATGEVLEPARTPESKPLNCTSIYALTKKDQEEYALLTGAIHKIPVTACRYFNVYGPRQSLSNPYTGVGAIFSSRLKNGNRPLIYEDGAQSRDFIHVRDLAAAKLFLLENPAAAGCAINLCTGRPTSIRRIAEILAPLYGRPDLQPEITGRFRAGDIRHCIGDPAAIEALGWRHTITLEEGLRELVAWSEGVEAVDAVERAHRELVERGLVSS